MHLHYNMCLRGLVLSTVVCIFVTTCALLQTTPTHVTPGQAPITAPITAPIQQPMGAYNYQPVPPTSEAYHARHQQRPTPPASPHQKVRSGILMCECFVILGHVIPLLSLSLHLPRLRSLQCHQNTSCWLLPSTACFPIAEPELTML